MKRLLVCTIMRNCYRHLDHYNDQLMALREQLKGHYEITVSIHENDSTDGTAELLEAVRQGAELRREILARIGESVNAEPAIITTDKLGTAQYGSVWSMDRLRNLAEARQRCLDQAGDLRRFSKIAYIEVDCEWDARWCAELILARHPAAAGTEPDIYSGWSLRSLSHPKESTFLYDTCATRAGPEDTCWDVTEWCGRWRGESLVPTNLGGVDGNCLHKVWSTFNCFCVYNPKPFIEGLKWDYENIRLNTGQERIPVSWNRAGGWLDADTAVMCEKFRAAGYTNVFLNTNCLIRHS